jgi:hypothetical protein
MKMRVRGNSIRLRLMRSEVEQFCETGLVEEIIEFGNGQKLVYALKSGANSEIVSAEFGSNGITVFVPQKDAKQWVNSNQVGIEAGQNIGNGKFLRLLIEKDFACLEPRKGEEDSDAFPHPSGNVKC